MKRSLAFTSRLRPFLVLIHPLLASSVEAQYSASPPPAAYALREVTVVSPGGEIRSGMTVIVRKGLIEAIAAGADIPPDAIVLEGSPLFLYPGMIDGDGRAAFELPEPDENAPPPVAWDPPRAAQGFTPHRRLVDYLTATPDSIRELRRKGIVALVAHPWGGLAPGRSALLVPREDAETPWGLVANPELGLAMAFRGARGVYPGSLFAVIAFLRQSFEDAKREGAILAEYEKDSWGMTLPRWDPDYRVLRGVAAVQRPRLLRRRTGGRHPAGAGAGGGGRLRCGGGRGRGGVAGRGGVEGEGDGGARLARLPGAGGVEAGAGG